MQDLDLCTGTLVIADDIAVECTNELCLDWARDRHELVLTIDDVGRVGERLAG